MAKISFSAVGFLFSDKLLALPFTHILRLDIMN